MRAWIGALEANVLLQRYVDSQNEKDADTLLERLLQCHATPLICTVVARKTADAGEAERITQLAQFRLFAYLRGARAKGQRDAVRNLKAFVTRLTEQAFGDFLDEKYPERRRLKDRLRYALRHQKVLAEWAGGNGQRLCGLAEWQAGGQDVKLSPRLEQLQADPCAAADLALPDSEPRRAELPTLIYALLHWIGHPVGVEEMVGAVGRIQGIEEIPASSTGTEEEGDDAYRNVADDRVNMERDAQKQAFLAQLWTEIARLPVRQRSVLLLGMKDASGNSPLDLFATARIASLRQIAETLELDWETFAALWKELPLEDKRIAALLGISPENVRFQRSTARNRLRERQEE